MLIETTININIVLRDRLNDTARSTGLSRRQVVSWILRRLADDSGMRPVVGSRLRYQDRDTKSNWRNSHITLMPAEYELFKDMKKIYKLSGSFLIAYAIKKYLYELSEKPSAYADNYRFTNYYLSRRVINEVVCWKQYWGLPPSLQAQHRYQT